MPDPVSQRLFAFYYPRLVALAENAGQRETRRNLIAEAEGRTLELGAGSGLNLPHYTDRVTELVLTEPSSPMLARLRSEIEAAPPRSGSWRLVQSGAERLPFPDDSFKTVVATYVLCTVPDPEAALTEINRVLAPGGRYLFLEHVHAGKGSMLGRFQDLIELPHRYVAAGCHPNRHTQALIESSPLEIERVDSGLQPRAFPSVRPTIIGSAAVSEADGAGTPRRVTQAAPGAPALP